MMYGLKLKAFYYEGVDTTWDGVEQVETSETEERQDLEKLKNELDSFEHSNDLATNVLDNLKKEDLAKFLSEKFFSGDRVSYVSFIKESPKTLNLCMRRALQLLSENDTKKYDAQWNESENWKTVKDLFDEKWINTKKDSTLIRILQKKVWAVPDWKPWPQTVALVISHLWWDIWDFYDKVNSIYEKTPDLKIKKVQSYEYSGKSFKYDTNLFYIRSATGEEWPRIVDANKKDDESEKWVEIRVVGEGDDRKLEAEGFDFTTWWLKKAKESPEKWTKNEEEKDPLKGLEEWVDYSEETANLIERYKTRFTITSDNQKEYIGVLNNIMSNPDKKWGLKSLLALNDGFWGSYKIDLEWIKKLEEKLDSAYLDWTEDTFEMVDDEDDYLTIRGGKLVEIAKNNESHHESVFEVNGTSNRDDYRFDSVEAFMKFIGWEKVIKASEHVETLSAKAWGLTDLLEDEEFKDYKNRFSDELLKKPAELAMTWDRYETFLSLLTLDDKFWWNCKLTVKDIQNFKRWMERNLFDYRSGSSTVFHANWSKFEVDWTGTFSDETFGSVREFFNWLDNKL